MFDINEILKTKHVVLAPMAGITSYGYRKFFEDFDIAFGYTEMVSDMGIIYGNKETESYIDFPKQKYPIGVQLFGSEPENIVKAALICLKKNSNIAFFDVNMGCPVPKVTRSGAGSSLLKTPLKCGEIVKSLKEATGLPISAKIRLGWDDKNINYFDVINELEKAGVDFIALHARTTKQLYLGKPNFELVCNLQSKMNVPLIISGNIYSPEEALNAMEITGARAVMLARGGEGNPYLANQIEAILRDYKKIPNPSITEQINYCKKLALNLIEEKGEDKAMRIYRSIAPKFFSSLPNSKHFRCRLSSELQTYGDLEKIIEEYMKDNIVS